MIKSKKNLLCFFLALVALVFSAMFAVSISPKANAEVTSIKILGFSASNDNVILLNLSEPISVTGGESIKLLVNDKEVNTSVYGTGNNGRSVYINLSKATYRPNDKYWNIRIPTGTVFGNYEVAEDYNLYNLYLANTGTYGIISQGDTTPLTIKGLNRVVPDHAGENRWCISLNADAADVDGDAIWNCGIVYATDSNDVNGEYTVYGHGNTIKVYKENDSSLGLIINYEVFGETQAATGSKRLVKIPKGTVWGGYLGKYRIAESFWLLYDGETFNYYNYDPTDKTPVTISCGNDVKSEDIVWSEVALTGMFSAKNIEKNGVKVIGYRYENALYESLSAVYGAIGETAPTSVSIDVVTVTLENVYGASIRLASDYQGLRFTVSISVEKAGEITDYGVFATSEAFLKKLGGDFTAIEDGKNGYKISSADKDFKTMTEGDSEIYSVVIDVSPANYNKNFVACGYLTVTYAGGTAKTVLADYSPEANLRSSYEVATKALENSSQYNERQLKIIRKYVDGVLDIDENYNLVGAERSYTIEKIADGQVKIVGKDGFDVASVKAFSIKGVRYSATFDSGTVTFDSKLLAAGQTATAGAFDDAASYLDDGIANDCG